MQTVSCRLPNFAPRFRFLVRSCGICDGLGQATFRFTSCFVFIGRPVTDAFSLDTMSIVK
jgi:hypothetical protein